MKAFYFIVLVLIFPFLKGQKTFAQEVLEEQSPTAGMTYQISLSSLLINGDVVFNNNINFVPPSRTTCYNFFRGEYYREIIQPALLYLTGFGFIASGGILIKLSNSSKCGDVCIGGSIICLSAGIGLIIGAWGLKYVRNWRFC